MEVRVIEHKQSLMLIGFILEFLLLSLQVEVDKVEEDTPAAVRGRNHAGQATRQAIVDDYFA